jgi:hypothetical protein
MPLLTVAAGNGSKEAFFVFIVFFFLLAWLQ